MQFFTWYEKHQAFLKFILGRLRIHQLSILFQTSDFHSLNTLLRDNELLADFIGQLGFADIFFLIQVMLHSF